MASQDLLSSGDVNPNPGPVSTGQRDKDIKMKFDDILELIGDFGTYQKFLLTMICLIAIPESMNSLSGVFLIAHTEHWCAVEEWENDVDDCYKLLSTDEEQYLDCIHQYRESSIPKSVEDGTVSYAECKKYDADYPDDWSKDYFASNFTTNTTACDEGWVYDQSQYTATVVSDFNLVCDKNALGEASQSVFYFGYLVGALLCSTVADYIGRKYSLVIAVGFNILLTMVTAFTSNYPTFAALRFFNGIFDVVMYLIAFIAGTELLGPSKRVYAGVLISVMYAVGYMTLGLLAFLIRDWRKLQFAVACSLLPFIPLMIIIPESARWLIAKKKTKAAIDLITKVAKRNKTLDKIPPDLEELLLKESELAKREESASIITLFRTPGLRLQTVNMMFNWFVNSLVYYGLAFNTVELGSNDYMAFFLSGLVEIPAYLICIPLIGSFLGRKWSTCILEVFAGIACAITAFVPEGTAKTTLAMVGKFCISSSYAIIYIYAAEIFPTVTRSAGVGLCSTAARIGNIAGPLILLLGDYLKSLPLLTYGLSAVIGGFLVILLPETRGKQLPESIAEFRQPTSRTETDPTEEGKSVSTEITKYTESGMQTDEKVEGYQNEAFS